MVKSISKIASPQAACSIEIINYKPIFWESTNKRNISIPCVRYPCGGVRLHCSSRSGYGDGVCRDRDRHCDRYSFGWGHLNHHGSFLLLL